MYEQKKENSLIETGESETGALIEENGLLALEIG